MLLKKLAPLSVVIALSVAVGACGGKEERLTKHFDRGMQHLADGDLEKARVEFKNVLQMDPMHVSANYNMGQAFEKLGDVRSAVGLYRKTLELDPQHVDAKRHLAKLYFSNGAVDLAAPLADELLAVSASDSIALTVRAGVKSRRGDAEGAERDVKAALMADPTNLDATLVYVSMLTNKQAYSQAMELVKSAIKTHSEDSTLWLVLADVATRAGDDDEAIAAVKGAIDADPANTQHRVRLAKYYAGKKRLDEAETVLRDMVTAIPDSTSAKLVLIDFLAKQREPQLAEKEFDSMLSREPENWELQLGRAQFLASQKRGEEAEKVLLQLVDRHKTSQAGLKARVELAKLRVGQEKLAEAKRLLDEVVKENTRDRSALELRAAIYLAQDDPVSAIADLRAILRDEPESASTLRNLAKAHLANDERELTIDTLKKLLTVAPLDTASRLQLVRLYTEANAKDAAIEELKLASKTAPESRQITELLLTYLIADKRFDEAQATIDQLRRNNDKTGVADYYGALLAQAKGEKGQAVAGLRAAHEKNPGAVEPFLMLVKTLADQGDMKGAHEVVDGVIKTSPNDFIALNAKGELLVAEKNYVEAAKRFARVIAINPKFATAHLNMAGIQLQRNDDEAALKTLKSGIEATDGDLKIHYALASFYEARKQDFVAARNEYEAILKSHPDEAVARNNLAMLTTVGEPSRAELDRAKELVEPLAASGDPSVLDTVGWVDYHRGDFDNAIVSLEKALRLVPSSALLKYHLGMAHYRKGNLDQARAHLGDAVQAETPFSGREEAVTTLASLENS